MVWKVKPPKQAEKIGKYEVLARVGAGASGAVYKGRDPDTGDLVAVKVLQPEVANEPSLVQRFEQEFLVARTLRNPHAVRAVDYGQHEGRPYLVMEYVEGEDLWEHLNANGRLEESRAIELIAQVGEALHEAHECGIIHRDIKPDNILLLDDGTAKLTDFGLVKDLASELNLTGQGDILGTPNFMAPEQFDDPTKADRRCDVYSLAATLYMAVTGKVPFDAKNYLATIRKKRAADLLPPRQIVKTLSPHVERAILAALNLDPDKRPATCVEFIQQLRDPEAATRPAARKSKPVPVAAVRRTAVGAEARERRQGMRYQCVLQSCCRPIGGEADMQWASCVRDISSRGIGLEVCRRFEPGAVLVLELMDAEQDVLSRLLIYVVRVQKIAPRRWFIGCTLHCNLNSYDLRLLRQASLLAASEAAQ
jgi:hypothetical protein